MRLSRLKEHISLLKDKRISFIDKLRLHFNKRTRSIVFNGIVVKFTDPLSFLGMYREIFVNEYYDFVSLRTDPFIIDCGSNIGLSLLYYYQKYPAAKVLAFEPDQDAFESLESNLSHLRNKDITLYNMAVWISDGELFFNAKGGTSGVIDPSGHLMVKSIRLKSILERSRIDFLKIDIEGAEVELLMDCATALRSVEQIFIEYHSINDREQELDVILSILKNAGFRYHIKEAYVTTNPYKERITQEGMDLQLNIFGYRE